VRLRPMTNADEPAVLALNAASADQLGKLGPDRLDWLRLIAAHAAVIEIDGTVVAFALTFAPGASYDRLDFQWFSDTYGDRFLYVDRIAVSEAHRRRGVGSLLYRAIERAAKPFDRLVCEVNADPPAVAALGFHAERGFVEVGKLAQADGRTTALLSKELT
jgi:predicted GNAT superfamily acetyltransferase